MAVQSMHICILFETHDLIEKHAGVDSIRVSAMRLKEGVKEDDVLGLRTRRHVRFCMERSTLSSTYISQTTQIAGSIRAQEDTLIYQILIRAHAL